MDKQHGFRRLLAFSLLSFCVTFAIAAAQMDLSAEDQSMVSQRSHNGKLDSVEHQLTLPDSWPAIHPLGFTSSSFPIHADASKDVLAPSVTASNDRYFVVDQYAESPTNHDIYGAFVTPAAVTESPFPLEITASMASAPDVAYAPDIERFLVVWEYVVSSQLDVYGQVFDRNGNKIGSAFAITSASSRQEFAPSVGYTGLGDFVVAYGSTQDFTYPAGTVNLYARRVSVPVSGSPTVSSQQLLHADGLFPDIARIDDSYVLVVYQRVWSRTGPSSDDWDWDIYARVVAYTGVGVGTAQTIAASTAPETRPCVAFGAATNRALFAWEKRSSSSDHDLYGAGADVDVDRGTISPSPYLLYDSSELDLRPKSVFDSTSNCFLLVWQHSTSGSNRDVYGKEVFSDALTAGPLLTVEDSAEDQLNPAIAALDGKFLISWEDDRNATYDIFGRLYTRDFAISGHVRTAEGSGIPGVTVAADNGGGSDITDSDGQYSLTVPCGWSGRVTPSVSGWVFSPSYRDYSNVTGDQTAQNYTGTLQPLSISGYVRTAEGAGIPGVTVAADNGGGSDITDSDGRYALGVFYDWSGRVTPSMSDYLFSPSYLDYSNVTSDQTDQNFTGTYTVVAQVATPQFSPGPGAYASPVDVTITCATAGATIRYTTDGSTPTEGSPQYTGPIRISTPKTLSAKAWKPGWTPSETQSGAYTILGQPTPPSPRNVQASDGWYPDRVHVTWDAAESAMHYEVYRGGTLHFGSAQLLGTTTQTFYDDLTAAVPDVTVIYSGCLRQATSVYQYNSYWYWVAAVSGAGQSLPSTPDSGYRGEEKTAKIYEKVLPSATSAEGAQQAGIMSRLAIRLRSADAIDPNSVWGVVTCSRFETWAVQWWPIVASDVGDGWVVYEPAEPWQVGDEIVMTAGARSVSGAPVGPVDYRFHVDRPTSDFQTGSLAKESDAVTVAALDDEACVVPFPAGVGATFQIGPDQVYPTAQPVQLPLPRGVWPGEVQVYYYHPTGEDAGWYPAENMEGWLVPDSYLETRMNGVAYIGFEVYHGGVVQLGPRIAEAASEGGFVASGWPAVGDVALFAMVAATLMVVGRRRGRSASGEPLPKQK